MILGKVCGTVVSTRKVQKLQGYKLLIIKPLFKENADYIVAADNIGAGIGETVLVTQGHNTQYALDRNEVPIDAIVVGIIDGDQYIEIKQIDK